ncbi:MAG: glycosyltransferase [Acidobacteriota bacterium]
MTDTPLVSVVMSVYNGENYLEKSIESILYQTFRNFEFIIINDGSTDSTGAILTRYQKIDKRIFVFNQENQGVIASLNRGCHLSKGKYIARMDADDISLPERLQKQVEYMELHPEIDFLGTSMELIDQNRIPLKKLCLPTMPGLIRWCLLFENCMSHASVMMRRSIIEKVGLYHIEAQHAEDYDLWTRASFKTKLANLPEVLLCHRIGVNNITSRYFPEQEQAVIKVMHSSISQTLNKEIPIKTIISLHQMVRENFLNDFHQIQEVYKLIENLYRSYLKLVSLNSIEAKAVALDAAKKILILTVSAARLFKWKALWLFIRAIKLNPKVLLPEYISRGIRKLI